MASRAAVSVGLVTLAVATPVVVHAVMADDSGPTSVDAVAPPAEPDERRPRLTGTTVETTTTTSVAAEPVDLGAAEPTRLPPAAAVPVAAPDDRRSWADYLGAVSPMDVNEAELAGAVFTWVNAERADRGLPPLAWSNDMAHSARWWSLQMVGYDVAHSRILHRLPERYSRTAENVGSVYPGDAALVHKALADSPGHLANMLDPHVDVVGIGVACMDGGRLYVTEHFGRRGPDTAVEGAAPRWRPEADASLAPWGTGRGPARCVGSHPASADPPDDPPASAPSPSPSTSPGPATTSSTRPASNTSTTTSSAPPPSSTTTTEPEATSTTSSTSTSSSTSSTTSTTEPAP